MTEPSDSKYETTGEVGVVALLEAAPGFRLRAVLRFLLGRFPLRRTPGLVFLKVLGSGRDGGFGLRPSFAHHGLFAVFRTDADADRFLAESPLLRSWRRQSRESLTLKLRAVSARGRWSGSAPFALTAQPRPGQPVAALTRASIRPAAMLSFWRHSPPSERSLAAARGCRLAAGLGEAPLLRQATFSLWDDQAAMDAYARTGAHLDAIRAAARDGYFTESMFCRFVPYAASGSWKGRSAAEIIAPAPPPSLARPAAEPCPLTASS
jgi:spheroidene monooxygenase